MDLTVCVFPVKHALGIASAMLYTVKVKMCSLIFKKTTFVGVT